MKTFIIALLIGIILGAGGYWALDTNYSKSDVKELKQQGEETVENLADSYKKNQNDIEQIVDGKMKALELHAESISKELQETGRVVRRRARDLGSDVMDTAADVEITTSIKAKLAADPKLSAWKISVSTSSRIVTLSGSVSSEDLIGRAMMLALETEDVAKVISTIQVIED